MTLSSVWDELRWPLTMFVETLWISPFILFTVYAIPLVMRGGNRRFASITLLSTVGFTTYLVWNLLMWWLPPSELFGWLNTLRTEWGVPSVAYGLALMRVTKSRRLLAATIVAGVLCLMYDYGSWAYESANRAAQGRLHIYGGPHWPPLSSLPVVLLWHAPVATSLYFWSRSRRNRASASPVCSHCSYTLTGLANLTTCPECGASFATSAAPNS